jgi:hypothetical protein
MEMEQSSDNSQRNTDGDHMFYKFNLTGKKKKKSKLKEYFSYQFFP